MTDIELKEKRKEYKAKLDVLNAKIKEYEKLMQPYVIEVEKLKSSCAHVIVCDDCKQHECTCKDTEWGTGSAKCGICGAYMCGWYCQKSPDHICHYSTEVDENGKRFTVLENGERCYMPVAYDNQDYENDDDCLFCHLPDERK